MIICGVNAFHGDASAAAFVDGQLRSAIEEERFNRIKHWAGLPVLAVRACLDGDQPDHIALSRDPRANFPSKLRRLITQPGNWSRLLSRAGNNVQVIRASDSLRAAGIGGAKTKFHFVEHHRAHLASAFY